MTLGQIFGQSASKKSILEVAEASMSTKNYYDALDKYKELLKFEPGNISYLYNAAEAARLHGAFADAKFYYEEVLKHESNNNYPLASLNLGRVKQFQGDYQGAKMSYLLYRTEHGNEDPYASSYADKEIKACEWAISQLNNVNKNIKFRRLGDNINSNWSDFAPTATNEILRFSSNRFDNIYDKFKPKRSLSKLMTSKSEGPAEVVSSPSLDFKGNGVCNASYSPDNSRAVFTVCQDINDYDKKCQLYKAKIDAQGNWSDVTVLPEFINVSDATNTHPCISVDPSTKAETLYFVSNRAGGKGMLDIWYSLMDASGNYSEPINLSAVNTSEDDITPFYDSESSTLYFSTRGNLGFGGFDMFSSKRSGSSWGVATNLGSPLNSSYDDIYFSINNSGKAYFSSNRTESKFIDDVNEVCCLDIYQADMPRCDAKLKTLVYDALTKEDLSGVTISLSEVGNTSVAPILITNDKGNDFSFPLNCDKEYKVEAIKNCYSKESIMFLSGRPGEFNEILKKINLKKEYIKVEILAFERQSGAELKSASISLYDLDESSKAAVSLISGGTANLIPCHKYRIVANYSNYGQATQEFKVDCNTPCTTMVQKIYLDKYLYSLLPVCLYFDNDVPRPGSSIRTTSQTYSQTYRPYYSRKSEYIRKSGNFSSGSTYTSTITSSDCSCNGSSNPIFTINGSLSPKIITRLGTNPEFGSLHGLSSSQVLDRFKKAAKNNSRDRDFLNNVFTALGFSGIDQVGVESISEVELPRGIVGNIGYSKEHRTTYVQLNNEPSDLMAFRFSGPNGCALHFMKTCGNHFFYCTGSTTTIYRETTNSSSGCNVSGTDMDAFFENNVRGGKEKLDLFIDKLTTDLAEGKKYVIYVKGYTSPLAQNEYNLNLGQRRIQSIKNEFAKCRGGILAKYIKSGLLVIQEKTFGEDTAPSGIPFDPRDPRSIFTVDASSERRVEIVDIGE